MQIIKVEDGTMSYEKAFIKRDKTDFVQNSDMIVTGGATRGQRA